MTRGRWLAAALGAAALGAALVLALSRKGSVNGERGGRRATAEVGLLEERVEATGEVTPLNRVEIKPPIAGRIESLAVEEGDAVRQGQVLAWMSSSDRAAILDAARAKGPKQLKRWEDTYKPTPLVAPLSGTVILRNVVVGQTVDGGTVLFAMADKLIVLARVDEADIGRVREGQPARISLDAYPDAPIEGRVASILYEGKNVSNVITYGVKVEPRSVPAFFRSQMTANVSFVVSSKKEALLVPAAAVSVDKSGEKRVFVPGPSGRPVARAVKTGSENVDSVEILEGLKAGDTVLVMTRRYVPQRASLSPLVMTGRGAPSSSAREGGRAAGQQSSRSEGGTGRQGGGRP